jgi:hypothetical protein
LLSVHPVISSKAGATKDVRDPILRLLILKLQRQRCSRLERF